MIVCLCWVGCWCAFACDICSFRSSPLVIHCSSAQLQNWDFFIDFFRVYMFCFLSCQIMASIVDVLIVPSLDSLCVHTHIVSVISRIELFSLTQNLCDWFTHRHTAKTHQPLSVRWTFLIDEGKKRRKKKDSLWSIGTSEKLLATALNQKQSV